MRPIQPGETFSQEEVFDTTGIATFAKASGDPNPLHFDAVYAATTRFGGIIASGPHTTSLLMGMVAAYFSVRGTCVGLGFSFRLRSAVRAEERVTLRWRVVTVKPRPSMGGCVVVLEGEAVRPGGTVAVIATGEVLAMTQGGAAGL